MKKSKFLLLTFTLIFFLGFSLILFPVEVMGASENEIDIEEVWVEGGLPLSAMRYILSDGKGIKFYVEKVVDYLFDEPLYVVVVMPVQDYEFNDGELYANQEYVIRFLIISDDVVSTFSYYLDIYGSYAEIPEWDRMVITWDVDQQRFVGPNYLFYWIDTSFDEGYDEGQNVGYGEGYDDGYSEGHEVGYDLGYNEGHDVGYSEGYDVGYDVGFEIAVPKMDILLITLIMYVISIIIYFKFNLKWVLVGTILLWFVPIFLVENLFIKIFSVIMIIVTIVITFFSDREEDY